MDTFYDVQQLLKKHGAIIYTRDRVLDLALMEEEVRMLHAMGIMEAEVFQRAMLILQKELKQNEAEGGER